MKVTAAQIYPGSAMASESQETEEQSTPEESRAPSSDSSGCCGPLRFCRLHRHCHVDRYSNKPVPMALSAAALFFCCMAGKYFETAYVFFICIAFIVELFYFIALFCVGERRERPYLFIRVVAPSLALCFLIQACFVGLLILHEELAGIWVTSLATALWAAQFSMVCATVMLDRACGPGCTSLMQEGLGLVTLVISSAAFVLSVVGVWLDVVEEDFWVNFTLTLPGVSVILLLVSKSFTIGDPFGLDSAFLIVEELLMLGHVALDLVAFVRSDHFAVGPMLFMGGVLWLFAALANCRESAPRLPATDNRFPMARRRNTMDTSTGSELSGPNEE